MRLFGPPDTLKLKNKKNIKGLEKALFYTKDRFVRLHAADYLGELGDKSAADSLVHAIEIEKDKTIKERATIALAKLKDTRAISPLIRHTAFIYSSFQPTQNYYNRIIDLIVDYGETAVKPLSSIIGNWHGITYGMKSLAVKCAVKLNNYQLTPNIIELIENSKDARTRKLGIWALGEMKDPAALSIIIKATSDSDQKVRKIATAALKYYEQSNAPLEMSVANKIDLYIETKNFKNIKALGENTFDLLHERLKENYLVQFPFIGQVLGRLKNPASIPYLIKAFAFTEEKTKEHKAVINAINKFEDTANKPLLDAIKNIDSDYDLRNIKPGIEAAKILAKKKDARAIKHLVKLLDIGGIAKSLAEKVLEEFNATEELLEELKNPKSRNRIKGSAFVLRELNEKKAIPYLIKLLRNKKIDYDVRKDIYFSLKGLTDEDFEDDITGWEAWLEKNKNAL